MYSDLLPEGLSQTFHAPAVDAQVGMSESGGGPYRDVLPLGAQVELYVVDEPENSALRLGVQVEVGARLDPRARERLHCAHRGFPRYLGPALERKRFDVVLLILPIRVGGDAVG